MKNNFSMATFFFFYFFNSFSKKSKIWFALLNWSSLVGDFLSCNKIPASIIFKSSSINAYHSFLTHGSIPRYIDYFINKYHILYPFIRLAITNQLDISVPLRQGRRNIATGSYVKVSSSNKYPTDSFHSSPHVQRKKYFLFSIPKFLPQSLFLLTQFFWNGNLSFHYHISFTLK